MFLAKLNVSIFPIGVLALLLASNNKSLKATWAQKLFNALCLFALCAMATDVIRVWLKCAAAVAPVWISLFERVLSCLLCSAIPATWLMYVYARVFSDEGLRRGWFKVALMLVPALMNAVITLAAPGESFAFYIDVKEPLITSNAYIAAIGMSLLETAFALAIACYQAVKASSLERRRVCLLLALFSFLPLIGQTVDVFLHGDWTVCLLYTTQLLILYVNVQNNIITTDALTGLNNRSEFDKYLAMLSGRGENNPGFYLFIMDIDDFKAINDKYGHGSGDEALRRIADVLRDTFGLSNAFFSRIGGDEFAMIIDMDMEAPQIIAMLKRAITRSDERVKQRYALSVSVGYTECAKGKSFDAKQLFEQADERMYAQKKGRGGKTA